MELAPQKTLIRKVPRLAFLLGGIVVAAHATTFIEVPFSTSAREAPIIVRARVGESAAGWEADAEGTRRIYTYTELEVQETLKGGLRAGAAIRARELGGKVGDEAMRVAGTARFRPGEDVVVLLGEQAHDGSYPVRGMMMGKLRVTRATDGTERLEGPALVGATRAGGRAWSLTELRKELRDGNKSEDAPNAAESRKAPSIGSDAPSSQPSPEEPPVPDLNNQNIKSPSKGLALSRPPAWVALAAIALAALAAWRWRRRRIALSDRHR